MNQIFIIRFKSGKTRQAIASQPKTIFSTILRYNNLLYYCKNIKHLFV